MNNNIKSLYWRYAVKKFDNQKKLNKTDLDGVLEAARLSASSYGLQPYKVLVIENQEIKNQLVEASYNQRQVADASHLLVFCAIDNVDDYYVDHFIDLIHDKRGGEKASLDSYSNAMKSKVNSMSKENKKDWAARQIYIALGNVMTYCANEKIDTCPMEGFIPQKYSAILGLETKGLSPIVALPIGYRSDDDKYKDVLKVRKDIEEIVEYI